MARWSTPAGRHIALRLTNPAWGDLVGDVLCIGGSDIGSGVFGGAQVALASVEIYDPVTQQFSLFGNMTVARQNHTATELHGWTDPHRWRCRSAVCQRHGGVAGRTDPKPDAGSQSDADTSADSCHAQGDQHFCDWSDI